MKSLEEIKKELQESLTEARFNHCHEVADTAAELAARFGLDRDRAYLAGLVHDICRDLAGQELLAMAATCGLPVDDGEIKNPVLLHGPLGAVWARFRWGVEENDVLLAIANHTLGAPGMGPLEKIIYIADRIAPGRNYPGVQELRQEVANGLDYAVLKGLEQSLQYASEKGYTVHPRTTEARNSLLETLQRKGN